MGAAGAYLLHVGLRQQQCPLPGSPFELKVVPGHAYAADEIAVGALGQPAVFNVVGWLDGVGVALFLAACAHLRDRE